ncbi:MAG: adventurous gliding motility lipoprotein CglB [Myxococcota bacterium]
MTKNWRLLIAFGLGAAGGFGAGCQTYDFEPVEPLAIAQTTQSKTVIAKQSKPNLMLLVDKSGSMDQPTNPADSRCPSGCGSSKSNLCPANCPTRWSELQNAMGTFLSNNGTVARMGMTAYPVDNTCGAPTAVRIELSNSNDVDAELKAKASEINAAIQGISSAGAAGTPNGTGGGTPTSVSLNALSAYAPLSDPNREDFILVLTDGLPNCNPQNANSCSNAAACKCTLANGNCGTPGSQFCTLGCLDLAGSVNAVTALRAKQIRTIMVGFGADTASGDGPTVLNAMAEAGGFARACPNATDAECGGAVGSCDQGSKLCTTKFYQASNGAELASALAQIGQLVGTGDPCVYTLESVPSDPRFLSVLIDGQPTASGPDTWKYEAGKVTFTGALCLKVSNATPNAPVKVEFRIVEGL